MTPTTTTPGPRWATQQAAAEYLGVQVRTIRDWIAAGRIPGYRFGPRLIRVRLDDIDALAARIPTAGGDAA